MRTSEDPEPGGGRPEVVPGPDLLAVALEAVACGGAHTLTILEPVRGPGGEVDDFTVVADSGMTAHLAGRSSVGRTLRELMPAPFADRLVALNREVLADGTISRHDMALREDADGAPLPLSVEPGTEERRRLGEVVRVAVRGRVVVMWRDVTETHAAQEELRTIEVRFRRLVEHASDPIIVTTADRTVTYVSPAVGRLLHLDPQTLVGTRFGSHFTSREDADIGAALYERVLAAPLGSTARAVARVADGEGGSRWVSFVATNWLDDPVVGGVVLNAHDVTEQHEAEQRLRHQALTDDLTGLPNRRWFTEALHRAIERSRRTRAPFALLLLDVDDFKVLNDSLGHSAGDRLLVEVSQRITSVLGADESVARLGGDEFVVLAEGLTDVADAERVAARVAGAAGARHTVGSLATQVTLSIGVATSDPGAPTGQGGPGGGAEALLAHADAALYEAKRRGRDRVEVFDPRLRARFVHRLHVESQLIHALDHDELTIHWQPIVRVADGRTAGVEALLRWQHPQRGLLPAAGFLPVAVDAGLMPDLCTFAIEAAMAQATTWSDAGGPDVFLNLAPVQLSRPSLVDDLAAAAARRGLEPARVQLEVAEDVLGADVARLTDQLGRMREHGFRIALDDFGAGNTALTWLRRLPIDTLKLDKDFAQTLDEGPTRTVVRSVVRLAADLGIATVAEGVETAAHLDFFTEAGCDHTQGYLHAHPQPAWAFGLGGAAAG